MMATIPKFLVRPLVSAVASWRRQPALSVLIYHRVTEQPDPLVPWAIDAANFDRQMALLKDNFDVIPLMEAAKGLRSGRLPRRAACVTFDDGYRDNLTVALPILRRHGLPATVFVATAFLDGGRMWNDTVVESVRRATGSTFDLSALGLGCHSVATPGERIRSLRSVLNRLKYLPHGQRSETAARIGELCDSDLPADLMLTSAEVRQLRDAGVAIGGHTASHPILAGMDPDGARQEIAAGKERLEALVGEPLRLFAYPNGRPGTDYRPEHIEAVRQLGFSAAVSTATGVAGCGDDPYQIPRFTPWDKDISRFGLRLARNLLSPPAARV